MASLRHRRTTPLVSCCAKPLSSTFSVLQCNPDPLLGMQDQPRGLLDLLVGRHSRATRRAPVRSAATSFRYPSVQTTLPSVFVVHYWSSLLRPRHRPSHLRSLSTTPCATPHTCRAPEPCPCVCSGALWTRAHEPASSLWAA
jgi:hypothetical protein